MKSKDIKEFTEEILEFIKGKTPKNLRIFIWNLTTNKKREVINKLEFEKVKP